MELLQRVFSGQPGFDESKGLFPNHMTRCLQHLTHPYLIASSNAQSSYDSLVASSQ